MGRGGTREGGGRWGERGRERRVGGGVGGDESGKREVGVGMSGVARGRREVRLGMLGDEGRTWVTGGDAPRSDALRGGG